MIRKSFLTNTTFSACHTKRTEGTGLVNYQTGNPDESDDQEWWLDSGATSHMSGEESDFTTLSDDKPGSVSLADKSEITSKGKGDIRASIFSGEDGEVPILLKDVLYVPGLKRRLLSISSFTEADATVIFQGSLCTIIGERAPLSMARSALWRTHSSPIER